MIDEYWESRFRQEGAMWKFDPSDSAINALKIFKSEKIHKILIPGFGYGRNGKLFVDNGFEVTGIEISSSAINLAREAGIRCKIHHGSVTLMPFDNQVYDGIFCYALVHLLNRTERRLFLRSCYNQLRIGGIMIFTVSSVTSDLFGKGLKVSKNRFRLTNGLDAFFYDDHSVRSEFSDSGMVEFYDIDEPVKFIDGHDPVKLKYILCRKT